jgi:hypothetical protein
MLLWKINSCGLKIENQVKREVSYLNFYLVFSTIIALVSAVLFMKPIDGDEDIFYAFVIFQDFFPTWEPCLSRLYRAFFLVMPFAMPTSCYLLIYLLSHMRFQFYIVNNFLENINCGYDTSNTEQLISDAQYQQEIKNRIKFCASRHAHIFE